MIHRLHRMTFVLLLSLALCAHARADSSPYTHLLDFIQVAKGQEPMLVFADYQGEFDHDLNQENLAYLNQNKGLLESIRGRLPGPTVHWKLANSSKRLLVVPEKRREFAELFEGYCREAIAYVLDRTQLPNPYQGIATLAEPLPALATRATQGITAYLVHNIADEYVEEYLFFSPEQETPRIKIRLSNLVSSGKIGSYTSKLVIGEAQQLEFLHDSYTLWQDSAKNPLNVLIVPVEETLHIALRPFTETAIQEHLRKNPPQTLEAVQAAVDDWIAVEEAVVGGLVTLLMPEVFARFMDAARNTELARSMADRDGQERYRYVQSGIHVVSGLGVQPAIALYRAAPQRFRQLIFQRPQLAAAPPS